MSSYNLHESYFGLTYIATGEQTDGRYFQCSTSVPAGDTGPPKHTHSSESEGFYILAGTLNLITDDTEHVLKAGDYFNVAPGTAHTWSNKTKSPVDLIITFSPSGIEDMFRELDQPGADFELIGKKFGMSIVE